jgi:hypothetical protein
LEAIELRHRIAALSATELVARAPDRWKRAALDLALALAAVLCAMRGEGYARRAVHRSAWELISAERAAR